MRGQYQLWDPGKDGAMDKNLGCDSTMDENMDMVRSQGKEPGRGSIMEQDPGTMPLLEA